MTPPHRLSRTTSLPSAPSKPSFDKPKDDQARKQGMCAKLVRRRKEDICPICYDDLHHNKVKEPTLHLQKCGHAFHASCLNRWVSTSYPLGSDTTATHATIDTNELQKHEFEHDKGDEDLYVSVGQEQREHSYFDPIIGVTSCPSCRTPFNGQHLADMLSVPSTDDIRKQLSFEDA